MKKSFLPLLGLLFLVSCATKVTPPAPNPVPGPPPMPPAPSSRFLRLTVGPASTRTNTINFEWISSPDPAASAYRLYFGTNTGTYVGYVTLGNVTNYALQFLSQLISSNPVTRIKTFPDGTVFTNAYYFFFVVTATDDSGAESLPSNEVSWPPPPPPPWTALQFYWGDVVRQVTIQQSHDLLFPGWTDVTNATGTNVVIPIPSTYMFYRGSTTDAPPVILIIKGGYL